MKYFKFKHHKYYLIFLIAVFAFVFCTILWRSDFVQLIKIFVSIVSLLFLPGFFITLCLYPHQEDFCVNKDESAQQESLDYIERLTLAITLSIVISSMTVFILYHAINLPPVGPKLTPRNLTIAVMGVNMIAAAMAILRILGRRYWLYAFFLGIFPFIIYFFNRLLSISLTTTNVFLELIGLIIVLITVYFLRRLGWFK